MRPPPIYPQLPHLHNHGLAMFVCITALQNVSTASILKPFEKKFFGEVIFSSNIIKPPGPQETKQKKLKESLQIKWKLTFWEEKDSSTSKLLFDVIPFAPSIIPFQKTFPKSLRKFS
jgi:hypothetical protein